jgi:hypothetical protein
MKRQQRRRLWRHQAMLALLGLDLVGTRVSSSSKNGVIQRVMPTWHGKWPSLPGGGTMAEQQEPIDLREDLDALQKLSELDIPSALNKIRFITEKVLHTLCTLNKVDWGQAEPTLERMLGPLVSTKCIRKDIGIHLRTIQSITSPGSHYQEARLATSHLDTAFIALAGFLEWYSKQIGTNMSLPILRPKRAETACPTSLKVVDVTIIKSDKIYDFNKELEPLKYQPAYGTLPLMDIKLRNTGDTPVFLKRLRFDTTLTKTVAEELVRHSYAPMSIQYTVLFDPYVKRPVIEISQVVLPLSVERFGIAIGHVFPMLEGSCRIVDYAYWKFRVNLDFNETETLPLGRHRVRTRSPFVPCSETAEIGPFRIPWQEGKKPWWKFW